MKTLMCVSMLLTTAGMLAVAQNSSETNSKKAAALDNCDPKDPNWAPVGCLNNDKPENNVTNAQFVSLVFSPFSAAIVGHTSWRFDPGYLTVEPGKTLRLSNEGGRPHTFTEVAQFGGGRIPPLNNPGLTPVPECALAPGAADPNLVAPGATMEKTLGPGEHRMQCCFHPWMRMIVKVEDKKK
jgi:plastocyanin